MILTSRRKQKFTSGKNRNRRLFYLPILTSSLCSPPLPESESLHAVGTGSRRLFKPILNFLPFGKLYAILLPHLDKETGTLAQRLYTKY